MFLARENRSRGPVVACCNSLPLVARRLQLRVGAPRTAHSDIGCLDDTNLQVRMWQAKGIVRGRCKHNRMLPGRFFLCHVPCAVSQAACIEKTHGFGWCPNLTIIDKPGLPDLPVLVSSNEAFNLALPDALKNSKDPVGFNHRSCRHLPQDP